MSDINPNTATCSAVILQKLFNQYKDQSEYIANELKKRINGYDISDPSNRIPLKAFNDIISWIEKELGPANLKIIGKMLGDIAYENLKRKNKLKENLSPEQIINQLLFVMEEIVDDPLKCNWRIVEVQNGFARVKKTQTLNSILQIGIIDAFIRRAGVALPSIRLIRDFEQGPLHDEYEIAWY